MNYLHTIVTTVAIALISLSVQAKEGSALLWIVMPYAKIIAHCAASGPDMQQQLAKSLEIGRKNAAGKLPDVIWKLLETANTVNQNSTTNAAIDCDAVNDMYRHPDIATHLRQAVVAQLVSQTALVCIIKQPDQADELKTAWVNAFTRNGLTLTEDTIDEVVDNAHSYIENMPDKTSPNTSDCEKVINYFSPAEFDAKYSVQGFYKLFDEFKK